jgi:hypothetical protein
MRKLMGFVAVGVALMALPHVALAQRASAAAAKNEIGVDLGAAYTHVGSGCTTSCGLFGVGTPVDIRWGFVSTGPVSFEPRFTLSYLTGGGGHALLFDPDLNVLYRFGSSTARKGTYATGGLGVALSNTGISGSPSTSTTQLSLNGGIGTRMPMQGSSSAWRIEGFFRYNFSQTSKGIPSSYGIGARIGMSFWR